jgi:hypothetical protein
MVGGGTRAKLPAAAVVVLGRVKNIRSWRMQSAAGLCAQHPVHVIVVPRDAPIAVQASVDLKRSPQAVQNEDLVPACPGAPLPA